MRWGIVDESGRVVAIVDSDARPASSYRIPAGVAVQVGWSWTGWEFRSPRWTSYEFLRRFSSGERDAIRFAAAGDSAVADLLMFLQTSTEVVSDDTTTSVGLAYLVHLGIITEARKAELLTP
jgi:hypothetical protein